jgi:hypothetical protein
MVHNTAADAQGHTIRAGLRATVKSTPKGGYKISTILV